MERISEWYDLDSLQSFYSRAFKVLKLSNKVRLLGEYFDSKYIEEVGFLDIKVETEYWRLCRRNLEAKNKQHRLKMVDDYFNSLLLKCEVI